MEGIECKRGHQEQLQTHPFFLLLLTYDIQRCVLPFSLRFLLPLPVLSFYVAR